MKLKATMLRVHSPYIDFKIRGHLNGIKFPCIAEVKYDGISTTVIKKKGVSGNFVTVMTHSKSRMFEDLDACPLPGSYLAELVTLDGMWDTLKLVASASKAGQAKLIFFDVISIGDVDMTEKDLLTRKEALQHMGVLTPAFCLCESKEQLEMFYKRVISLSYEGIVVKNLDETFLNQKWVKMKPPERMTHGTTETGD